MKKSIIVYGIQRPLPPQTYNHRPRGFSSLYGLLRALWRVIRW